MKTFCSSLLLGCLVTLSVPSMAVAQDDDGAMSAAACEQEARKMGMTAPEDIAAYVKSCEAGDTGDSSDDGQDGDMGSDQDTDQSSGQE